jgi:hypothetical protein
VGVAGPAPANVTCNRPHRCADVVINPVTGAQRQLGGSPVASVSASSPGVIAPDGATAALFRVTAGGQVTLHLVSLATGADQRIAVPLVADSVGAGKLAWSPDSQWLFVITAHGGLAAVNARTQRVQGLGAASVAEPDRDQERIPLSALPVVFSWRSGRYKHVKVF